MATVPFGLRDANNEEVEISLRITEFETEATNDYVLVNECFSQECLEPKPIVQLDGYDADKPSHTGPIAVRQKQVFSSLTGFLQIVFKTSSFKRNYRGFQAEWYVEKVPDKTALPPPPSWQRATAISEPFSLFTRVSSVRFDQQPDLACAGQPLVFQPHLRLLDTSDLLVLHERITVNVTVESSSSDLQLVGTTQQTAVMGYVHFTDLQITAATSKGVRLKFHSESGSPPMPLLLESQRFPVMPASHRMAVQGNWSAPEDGQTALLHVYAGDTLPPINLRLDDAEGYQSFASNTAVTVTLLGAPMYIQTPTGIHYMPILGNTTQKAQGGLVTFADLRLIWASQTTMLVFSAPHIGLHAMSRQFTVLAGYYTGLKFAKGPSSGSAGLAPGLIDIALIDDFGNSVKVRNVGILIESRRIRPSDPDPMPINATGDTNALGVSSFSGLVAETRGEHVLTARLVHDRDKCLNSSQFLAPPLSSQETARICEARGAAATDSAVYVVNSMPDAVAVRVTRSPSGVIFAGEPFAIQPACEVLDSKGNAIDVRDYHVLISVTDSHGQGCLCDLTKSEDCVFVASSSTVQQCPPDGCPFSRVAPAAPPAQQTVLGEAQWDMLACTKATCFPNCDARRCGHDNCNETRAYKVTCTVTGGECNPCTADSDLFHVYPNRYGRIAAGDVQAVQAGSPSEGSQLAGFFASVNADGSLAPRDGSFVGVVASGSRLVPSKQVRYHPWFKASDIYGNLNTTVSGTGLISLPFSRGFANDDFDYNSVPAMAGFGHCQTKRGTACLSGDLSTQVDRGVGYFPEVYVRHPGPGYRFEFEFEGKIARSQLFSVLPPPPRVTGISFSETFSNVIVRFDVDTNLGGMQGSTDCAKLLTSDSLHKVSGNLNGTGAMCSWPDASSLLVSLGNGATLTPGDGLEFTKDAVVVSGMHWRPVVQAGGNIENQRVHAADASVQSDDAVMALSSMPMPHVSCQPVILPEKVQETLEITAGTDVAAADIEFFAIDGLHYFAVANHCQGRNCFFDVEVMYTTGKFDIDSIIYQWLPNGALREHQRLATHGAVDVKKFEVFDALNTGGYANRHFLAIVNSRSSDELTSLSTEILTWERNVVVCHDVLNKWCFVSRQNISTTGGSSVDVHEHGQDLFIVICSTGPSSFLTILRWVPGSFRSDSDGPAKYGWPDGVDFGWVPGLFAEPVQTIPTQGALSAILYSPVGHSALFLAVSNYVRHGSNQVDVTIYRWIQESALNQGLFDSFLSIPALGARSVTPFSVDGHNYLAIANHFDGDAASEQSVHYQVDSFIYAVDYNTQSFELHQVLATAGAFSMTVFEHEGSLEKATYLAVANMRGALGLATSSRVYKWISSTTDSSGHCTSRFSRRGGFEEAMELPTVGASHLTYIWREDLGTGHLMSVLRAGMGVSGAIYRIHDLVLKPQAVVAYASVLGMCDALDMDARGSLNSGGRPFEDVSWSLLHFTEAGDAGAQTGLAQYHASTAFSEAMQLVTSSRDLHPVVPMRQISCPTGVSKTAEGWNACWNSTFLPAGHYQMRLTLRNWIGGVSHVDLSFEKRHEPVPRVMIANGHTVRIRASATLLLHGMAEQSSCASGQQPNLEYFWSVVPAVMVDGITWDPGSRQQVVIQPFTLPDGQVFNFSFTARAGSSISSASVQVHVQSSTPIARIEGGNRLVSLSSDAPTTYTLDASASKSRNVRDGALMYHWTCYQNLMLVGLQKFDCKIVAAEGSKSSPRLEVLKEKLTEHAYTFSPGLGILSYTTGCEREDQFFRCDPTVKYVFAVTVCDVNGEMCTENSLNAASARVDWTTSRQDIPQVVIASRETTRISNSQNLVFEGDVVGSSAPRYFKWVQLAPEGSQLLQDPSNLLSPTTRQSLVMKPGLLHGADRYIFRVYAAFDSAKLLNDRANCLSCGWAQVSVTPNLPPISGTLRVAPSQGHVLETLFELSAEQWVDPKIPIDDYPLRFGFGFIGLDGQPIHLSSSSLLPRLYTVLPSGSDTRGCSPTESLCRRLQVTLQVYDAQDAWGRPSEPSFLRVDNMEPGRIREIIERQLDHAQLLADSRSGSDLLSKCVIIANAINDPSVNFAFYNVSDATKIAWRDRMISHVDVTVNTIFAYLTVPSIIQVLGAVSSIVGINHELSNDCVQTASSLLKYLSTSVLTRARAGASIPEMTAVLENIKSSLNQTATASSRLSGNQVSLNVAASPGQVGMDFIDSISALSKLSVAFHAAGQQASRQEASTFLMVTERRELEQMSGLTGTLVGEEWSRCPDCLTVVPTLKFSLPRLTRRSLSGLTASSYEVQSALIYDMILPADRTTFRCIAKVDTTAWSSEPVLVPVDGDVSGKTVFKRMRTGVKRFGFTNCPLLSVAALLVVREFQSNTVISQIDQHQSVNIRLSFDPTVRQELKSGSVDFFTGVSSSASCVRWDEDSRMWTSEGIEHVDVSLGDVATGAGAYVECKTKKLGTFAVSEVPRDCLGVVLGSAVKDLCGVCNGDNSTCSGCDGAPNSGRTKECSGHGTCASSVCACMSGWHGVNCHVLCRDSVNCSGHGRCSVTFEGLSMDTSVGCLCDDGFRKESDELNKRPVATCEFIPLNEWEMPAAIFWALVAGVPVFGIACVVYCTLQWYASREARYVNAMRKDVESYMDYYMQANEPIKLDKTDVNADLCIAVPAVEGGEEELPVALSSTIQNNKVASREVQAQIADRLLEDNKHTQELTGRTALPEVDLTPSPLLYGVVADHALGSSPNDGALSPLDEQLESHNENLFEDFEDWRLGHLRHSIGRLNTTSRRASRGPKRADDQAEEEVAV